MIYLIKYREELEKELYEQLKILPEQERNEFLKKVEEENKVTIERTDDKLVIIGDQCIDAKSIIWKRFRKEVYFKSKVNLPEEWENVEEHYNKTKIQVFKLSKFKHSKEYAIVNKLFMDTIWK